MLFLSPVIYGTSALPSRYQAILRFNPLVGILDAFRAAVLPTRSVDWDTFWIACAVTTVLFVLASIYFYRTERSFADLI
jgi:lipopolysaccharide transport system permease protein